VSSDRHDLPAVIETPVTTLSSSLAVPAMIANAGERAARRFKQHLAAIRMLFDWLVVGQVLVINPAHAVRGPKHVVKRGKTPVLSEEQARRLLAIINVRKNDHVSGRDGKGSAAADRSARTAR
jgi:site-specific recombinase XerC